MLTLDELVPSATRERFSGVYRPYAPEDVLRLRGSIRIRHTLAEQGANRLWSLLHSELYVAALGAVTGNQAMQMVKAGLNAIYLSGWQIAADNNCAGAMYPVISPAMKSLAIRAAKPRRSQPRSKRTGSRPVVEVGSVMVSSARR